MWKLCFLSVAWLVQIPVFSQENSSNNQYEKYDLEAEFDRIAEDLLSSFSLAHSTISRSKRELDSDMSLLIDQEGVYRLNSIVAVSKLCSPAVYSKFLDVENETYAICGTEETAETSAEIVVGVYRDNKWNSMWRWFVDKPNGFSAFYFKGFINVLIADSGKADGTTLGRINLATLAKEEDRFIFSKHAVSISTWKMKVDNKYHMAIANTAGYQDGIELTSEVFVYEWLDTYFDEYDSFRAYDVKDIEPFHIHGAAYMAVANFRRSENDYEVDSEILKYNLDEKRWISFQKIRTYGAMDWEFFTLGSGSSQDFFLAVANKEGGVSDIQSIIYMFVKDRFVSFQCLPTSSAVSISSWSEGSKFVLAVANLDAVYLYQYDGSQFISSLVQYTRRSMSFGVTHLEFHSINKDNTKVAILSVSNHLQYNELSIFEIGFKYENLLQTWNEDSSQWCLNTLQNLDTDPVLPLLNDVVFIDQQSPITINGNLYFENGFEAKKLSTPQLREIVTQETYDSTVLMDLQDLQRRLDEIKSKVDVFEDVLRNSLQIEGNQTVLGNLQFQDVRFDCEKKSCHFDSIQTTVLNGEEIGDWNKNLIFLDREQVIDGILFTENINAKELNVFGMIDGVDVRTLVTNSGNHTITAPKTFTNPVKLPELEVYGLVDGVKISPAHILLTSGHQTVTGNLNFDYIDTAWLKINGTVNGIDLSEFYEDAVRSDQPSIVTGRKTFHDIAVDDLTMSPGSTINGIDLVDLWKNALWMDGDQKITAPMTFKSMSLKNLDVPNGINGIQIPGPRIVNINEFANVPAPHVFEASTTITQLNVLNSLNGLGTQEVPGKLPRLDIMLKTGDQIVTGEKKFHTIHLDSNSFVTGVVNGVDLSELKKLVLRRDSSMDSNRTWKFNNLKIKGPLTINKIDGHDLNDIYDRALKLNDSSLSEIIFKKTIFIEELQTSNINGIDVENDFVLRDKKQVLTGNKVFQEIILEENSFTVDTINNMNVRYLTETLLKVGNQVLNSKVFNRNVKINKLTVNGSINNVPVSEFVTLSGNEKLLHSRELINVTFNEIKTNNLEIAGLVNNINIEEMMKDTMTYEGHETVTGKKTVNGLIHVNEGDDLTVGYINGVNIGELWNDAVFLEGRQEISGQKVFKAPVSFDNLIFDTIDGVSESDIKDWMLKNVPQTVEGDVTFARGLSVRNLEVKGYINNGINITQLDASLVKTNEHTVIEGPVIFKTLISEGDVTLSGRIQGIDLSEEAVTKHGSQEVSATKTFTRDLVIKGDATVNGLVDGVLVEDLCRKPLLANGEQNVTKLTIKGDVTFLEGGTIDGKIAGIDLAKLHEIAVSSESDEITFSGKKTFENLTIEGPVTLEGKLGGVDLEDLYQTYMSLTRDQNITSPMEFDKLDFTGTVSAFRLNTKDQIINGVDISSLKRVLKIDTDQTVTAEHYFDEILFQGDVFVAGKVNGLEVPNDLMRHNHTNFIRSPKAFRKPLHVLGNLIIADGKRIQGVDVSEWFRKAVQKNGSMFIIDGYKTFHDLSVIVASVGGKLDGVNISESSLLMTYGDQTVTGRKIIKRSVNITGSLTVNGRINGVDLNLLDTKTLQRGRNNTITGIKSFSKPLTIKYLEAPSVAGVDVKELERKITTEIDFEPLQHRLTETGEVVARMEDALNKQAVVFQYYELFQVFNIPSSYNWLYVFGDDCGELLLLSDNSSSYPSCSSIRFFEFSHDPEMLVGHPQDLLASFAVSLKSLNIEGTTFLFVANQNSNPLCSERTYIGSGNAASDIYIWKDGAFHLHQSLEMRSISHMVVFKNGNLNCAVYIEFHQCTVYCSEGIGLFQHLETLPTRGGRRASIVQSDEKTILAIVTEDLDKREIYVEDEKSVEIFIWNPEYSKFASPRQVILSSYAQSVLLMNYVTEYSSHIFLVVAEGRIPKVQNEPKLLIYRYEDSSGQFMKYQEIKDYGELDWIVLQTGELILFVLDSHMGILKLYQHKGVSGFVSMDSVNSIGSINVHAFIRQEDRSGTDHYVALAGPRAPMAHPSQGIDYAKILKSKMKGNRHFINY